MLDRSGMMQMARSAMAHAAGRQLEIARNVANADTPGYRSRDVVPFDPDTGAGQLALRQTRPQHLGEIGQAHLPRTRDAGGEPSPNGNSVSLEDEMVRAAEARREHELAVTVYQSGLRLMRSAINKRG
ncbi:FlgB family protein [Paracoccus suum]|uniref:FlgB family protein n=1 Tax=Paracoccus suum TaxID=2259340 RepID=A0A344PGS2_9RHOB|nr:FlgB family protein [Paracoccus suum]AXC48577.1 FlgB family protein [Paracoccus suum]